MFFGTRISGRITRAPLTLKTKGRHKTPLRPCVFPPLLTFAVAIGLVTPLPTASFAQELAAPSPVGVIEATIQETYIATRFFAGRIESTQVSDLGFELPGRVVEFLVEEGDMVEEGQQIARLDTDQLVNRRASLLAQRAESEANLSRAESTLQRIRTLRDRGFSPQQELDNILAERDGLIARINQIDAQLDTVDTDTKDSVLEAPFSGQIVNRYVDEGTVVQSAQRIVRINAAGSLEARIGVPPSYRQRINPGETYDLTAGPLTTTGTVISVVSNVNTQTRTLTVILKIDEDPGFVPRDLVRLALTEEIRETGIWVPATALNEGLRGLWTVFTVTPDDNGDERIERKDVELIHIEEDRAFVRGTLEEGDLVVRAAPFRFVPGQRVSVVKEAE